MKLNVIIDEAKA